MIPVVGLLRWYSLLQITSSASVCRLALAEVSRRGGGCSSARGRQSLRIWWCRPYDDSCAPADEASRDFFPSNAFMASARSLHTFNRGKQLNCSLHAGLSPCRKPQKCRLWTSTQSRNCPSKRTDKKANQKQQSKNSKNTQPKHKPNQNDREKWDRNQQWELHA